MVKKRLEVTKNIRGEKPKFLAGLTLQESDQFIANTEKAQLLLLSVASEREKRKLMKQFCRMNETVQIEYLEKQRA